METCNKVVSEKFPLFPLTSSRNYVTGKHMLLSAENWRKHFEKWSGYPVSAATETCVKVMILSSQAYVSRNDSTIELKVSATLR